MTKGKIFLVPFPYDDLSANKLRPVACLTNPLGARRHVILAYITSRLPTNLLETDIVLDASHPDFSASGLRVICYPAASTGDCFYSGCST